MAQHGALDLHHHRNRKFSKGFNVKEEVNFPPGLAQKCQQVCRKRQVGRFGALTAGSKYYHFFGGNLGDYP